MFWGSTGEQKWVPVSHSGEAVLVPHPFYSREASVNTVLCSQLVKIMGQTSCILGQSSACFVSKDQKNRRLVLENWLIYIILTTQSIAHPLPFPQPRGGITLLHFSEWGHTNTRAGLQNYVLKILVQIWLGNQLWSFKTGMLKSSNLRIVPGSGYIWKPGSWRRHLR